MSSRQKSLESALNASLALEALFLAHRMQLLLEEPSEPALEMLEDTIEIQVRAMRAASFHFINGGARALEQE